MLFQATRKNKKRKMIMPEIVQPHCKIQNYSIGAVNIY